MKEEIKEILNYLKKKENTRRIKCITIEESKQLLYYITDLEDTLKDREEYCYGLETQLTNLQEENERLNENKRYTLNAINRTIEIIKQQPTEDDSWILDRLDGFKYLLKGDKDE